MEDAHLVPLEAVLDRIRLLGADNRDYPAVLREVLWALEAMHPGNWQAVRAELSAGLREELAL